MYMFDYESVFANVKAIFETRLEIKNINTTELMILNTNIITKKDCKLIRESDDLEFQIYQLNFKDLCFNVLFFTRAKIVVSAWNVDSPSNQSNINVYRSIVLRYVHDVSIAKTKSINSLKWLIFADQACCSVCKETIESIDDMSFDYIFSPSQGGVETPDNFRVFHKGCLTSEAVYCSLEVGPYIASSKVKKRARVFKEEGGQSDKYRLEFAKLYSNVARLFYERTRVSLSIEDYHDLNTRVKIEYDCKLAKTSEDDNFKVYLLKYNEIEIYVVYYVNRNVVISVWDINSYSKANRLDRYRGYINKYLKVKTLEQQVRVVSSGQKLAMIRKRLYKQDSSCKLCNLEILNKSGITIDHIRAKSKGGKNKESNYQIAHQYCNELKGNACNDILNKNSIRKKYLNHLEKVDPLLYERQLNAIDKVKVSLTEKEEVDQLYLYEKKGVKILNIGIGVIEKIKDFFKMLDNIYKIFIYKW